MVHTLIMVVIVTSSHACILVITHEKLHLYNTGTAPFIVAMVTDVGKEYTHEILQY